MKAPSANTTSHMNVIGGIMRLNVGDAFTDPGATCDDAEVLPAMPWWSTIP